MVAQSSWFFRVVLTLVLLYSSEGYLKPYGANVCSMKVSQSQPYHQSYQYSRTQSYTTKCGFFGWGRCTRYRTVYGTSYRVNTRIVYKLQWHCCKGWSQLGDQCSKPICVQPCFHGNCTQPDYCSCKSGYHGTLCDRDCPSHKWGPHCKHDCLCQNNSTCSPHTGNCTCAPAWQGQYCNRSCDHGYYGNNCQNKCQCQNGSLCDVITGKCTCAVGYTGIRCDKQCPDGFYGLNCTLKCACANGLCGHVDGSCDCSAVSLGANCCTTPDCTPCLNGGECDRKTGLCNCTDGWTGKACEQMCPLGTYGHSCSQKCTNHCKDNEVCDHVTGKCECIYENRERCKNPCKEDTFGPNCSQICACQNNSTCSSIDGSCSCTPGYTGVHCELCSDSDGRDCSNRQTQSDETSDVHGKNATLPIILSVIPLIALIAIAIGCFVWYKRSKRMSDDHDTADNYTEATETTTGSPRSPVATSNTSTEERIYQTPSPVHPSTNNRNNSFQSRHYDEPLASSAVNHHVYETPSIKHKRANAHDCNDTSVAMASRNYMELQKPSKPNIYEPMSAATKNSAGGVPVHSSEYDVPYATDENDDDDDVNDDNDDNKSTDYQRLQHHAGEDYEHLNNSTRHPLAENI